MKQERKYLKNKIARIMTYSIIITLSLYGIYKIGREIFWVEHLKGSLDENITVNLRIDVEMLAFLDAMTDKRITLYNRQSKNKLTISFESLEQSVEFYIDTFNGVKAIKIRDEMWGYNVYDYNSLRLLNKENNFHDFNTSYTNNEEILPKIEIKPILVYDYTGLYR